MHGGANEQDSQGREEQDWTGSVPCLETKPAPKFLQVLPSHKKLIRRIGGLGEVTRWRSKGLGV